MAMAKLKHSAHECVLTSPEIVADGICDMCYKDEPVEFACNPCNFDLCKACSNIPPTVSHDFHTEHPLEFRTGEVNGKTKYMVCYGCGNMFSGGFYYECKECEIYLELGCALMENIFRGWNAKELLHYSHSHLLRRSRPGPDAKGSCLLCELPLSPSAICYGCVHCYLFVHEHCFGLPTEIHHPVHPAHPLKRLHYTQILGDDARTCDACDENLDVVSFCCLECDLDLHLRCADSLLRALIHKYHEHRLFYVASTGSKVSREERPCQICMGTIENSLEMYYYCVECDICFHFECLEIPEFVNKTICHIHPLVCKIFLNEEDSLEHCGVCETIVYAGHHAYSCQQCDFRGHIECILREEKPSPLYLKEVYSCGKDITASTDREDRETNSIENKLTVNDVEHIHLMRPAHMQSEKNEDCDMCGGKMRGGVWKCETCPFETHQFCAELAGSSIYQFHPDHPLTLLPEAPRGSRMDCDTCNDKISGFNLFCRICSFIIHISCVLKGTQFIGALHRGQKVIGTWGGYCILKEHLLFQVFISRSYTMACALCDKMLSGKVLSCLACGDLYHPGCVKVERKDIVDHPIHSSHRLEFTLVSGSKCIACKQNMAKYGYQCGICRVSFHLKCIQAVNVLGNTEYHNHHLYNFWEDDSARTCNVCAKPCGASFYACIGVGCHFSAHGDCLGFPDTVRNQQHQHTVTYNWSDNEEKENCPLCGLTYVAVVYNCIHCKATFHKECIMSMEDREAATQDKQLREVYLMHLEIDLYNLLRDETSVRV